MAHELLALVTVCLTAVNNRKMISVFYDCDAEVNPGRMTVPLLCSQLHLPP